MESLQRWRALVERAYHGSPHKFDRFSLDHVGKGEGVQAYGYGLYFAGKREVAEFYRDSVGYVRAMADKTWTPPPGMPQKAGQQIVDILSKFFGQAEPSYIMSELRKEVRELPDIERYVKQLQKNRDSYVAHVRDREMTDDMRARVQARTDDFENDLATAERELKRAKILVKVLPYLEQYGVQAFVAKGHVYDVDIPEEDEFLLWDATLNQQPPKVTAAIDQLEHPVINEWRTNGAWDHVHGKTLYSVLAGGMTYGNLSGQKAASAVLQSLGVAGIKYLDAHSRDTGDGSYNYVVFDDKRVSISEDANSTIAAYQTASGILTKLSMYLFNGDPMNHYGFKYLRFSNGETMLTLRGRDIGLSDEDAALWFRFGVLEGYAPHGSFSKFAKSSEPVITVLAFDALEDTEQVAKDIIYKKPIHHVLRHEIIHYLDSKRNPKMGGDQSHGPAYFNSPQEFNAYFTNLATPLLHFLQAAREEPDRAKLQRFAKGYGISRDFQANLAMMVKEVSMNPGRAAKLFYDNLYPRNRRALLKRLYGLHQQVIAYLDG